MAKTNRTLVRPDRTSLENHLILALERIANCNIKGLEAYVRTVDLIAVEALILVELSES